MTRHRSKASGQEAKFLREAEVRMEAAASILSAVAFGHVATDIDDVIVPVIAVIDDAAKFVHLAGEP
jgi:hypothetical protein